MDESAEASEHDEELTETPEPQDTTDMLRAGLAAISNDIRELKQDLRHQLSTFKDELKKEVKEEINNLISTELELPDGPPSRSNVPTEPLGKSRPRVHLQDQ